MSWWNDLDFGDVGGWIGGVAGLGALTIALLARKDSKSSAATAKLAREDSRSSAETAKEALTEARRSSDAAIRSADAEEAALDLARKSAAASELEVRRSAGAAVKAAEAADRSASAAEERVTLIKAANEYRYPWLIKQRQYGEDQFEVHNTGIEPARQVAISSPGRQAQPDAWPTIEGGDYKRCFVSGPVPDVVTVSWLRPNGDKHSTDVTPDLWTSAGDAPDWDR